MRHIPEDELHAYLDQGLSRTQCVEIESHLADCPSCQATRDGIAALRDRTTALLARLAPPRSVPPAVRECCAGARPTSASQRRRRLSIVAWAASLVAAVGLGWSASSFLRAPDAARPIAPVAARESATAERSGRLDHRRAGRPAHRAPAHADPPRARAGRRPTRQRSRRPAASEPPARPRRPPRRADSARPPRDRGGALGARSDAGARADAGSISPTAAGSSSTGCGGRCPGTAPRRRPASGCRTSTACRWCGCRCRPASRDSRPVMVVAQQLASGQVIRTIEGPASDVSQMLSRRAMADVDAVLLVPATRPRSGPTATTPWRCRSATGCSPSPATCPPTACAR